MGDLPAPRRASTTRSAQERKTLLRASYARYADQLGGSIVSWDNPVGGAGTAGSRYVWNDRNHDHNVQPGELGAFIQDLGGFNHLDPERARLGQRHRPEPEGAPDRRVPALRGPRDLPRVLGVGLTGTYRHRNEIVWSPYIGATAASYTNVFATGLPGYDVNGNVLGVTGPIYTGTLGADFNGGEFVTNRPDYSQDYYGAQLQVTKRLTNNWMMHGSFAYNDWKQNIDNKRPRASTRPTSGSTRIRPSARVSRRPTSDRPAPRGSSTTSRWAAATSPTSGSTRTGASTSAGSTSSRSTSRWRRTSTGGRVTSTRTSSRSTRATARATAESSSAIRPITA